MFWIKFLESLPYNSFGIPEMKKRCSNDSDTCLCFLRFLSGKPMFLMAET